MANKRCYGCKKVKNLSEFHKRGNSNKVRSRCKSCRQIEAAERYNLVIKPVRNKLNPKFRIYKQILRKKHESFYTNT